MSTTRFHKVGTKLAVDIDQFPIVRDERTNLMWDRREFDSMTDAQFDEHVKKLNAEKFGGYADWRKPECDELLTLVDRSLHSPAIDVDAFPYCKKDWYRSATAYACSPAGCAWLVYFSSGYCSWGDRSYSGFVRAVRVSQ